MTYSGVDHARARRTGLDRLLDIRLTACELAICVGSVLLVGLIGVAAGGALVI
jgi:hypothetical protein